MRLSSTAFCLDAKLSFKVRPHGDSPSSLLHISFPCSGHALTLAEYNTIQCDKRNAYRRKIRDGKRTAEGEGNDTTLSDGATTTRHKDQNGEEPPAHKKARTSLDPMSNGGSSHVNGTNGIDDGDDETIDDEDPDTQLLDDEDDEEDENEVFEDAEEDMESGGEGEKQEVLEDDGMDVGEGRRDLDDDEGSESD